MSQLLQLLSCILLFAEKKGKAILRLKLLSVEQRLTMEGYEITLLYTPSDEEPCWVIPRDPKNESICQELDHVPTTGTPQVKVGFKGFLIRPVPRSFLSRGKLVSGPKYKELQVKLLETANNGHITEQIRKTIQEKINEQQ